MLINILTISGSLLTAASVAFAGYQLVLNRRERQAQFLFDTNVWLLSDPAVRAFYYRLDYNRWTFDPDTFRLSPEEELLDRLLHTLDMVQRFVESGLLRPAHMAMLQMDMPQILNNPEVQKYFAWLDTEFPGLENPPYAAARRLAAALPPYA